MYHVSLQVYCARLYSNYLVYLSSLQIHVKGIISTRLNFLINIVTQFQYFADPSHDTEAYREVEELWYDGLCLKHKHRDDFFCQERSNNLLKGWNFTQTFLYGPLFVISLTFLPPIIYIAVVSIRFYGAKNWLDRVLKNPAYIILPVTTCLSFYERINSYKIQTDRNDSTNLPNSQEKETDREKAPENQLQANSSLSHEQEKENIHSSEASFQKGMDVKKEDENRSNTNYNYQKSTEDQVVHSTENLNENPKEIYALDDTFSNIVVDDNEHAVVIICEEIEDQDQDHYSKAKNQTVSKKSWSDSNNACYHDNEENKTSAAAMEMTFSVSQSSTLYAYYMCLTTLLLLTNYLSRLRQRKFLSVNSYLKNCLFLK